MKKYLYLNLCFAERNSIYICDCLSFLPSMLLRRIACIFYSNSNAFIHVQDILWILPIGNTEKMPRADLDLIPAVPMLNISSFDTSCLIFFFFSSCKKNGLDF